MAAGRRENPVCGSSVGTLNAGCPPKDGCLRLGSGVTAGTVAGVDFPGIVVAARSVKTAVNPAAPIPA